MTFSYTYKTSDGIRHEGEIDAPGRDEAFTALRQRGIRPIKVVGRDSTHASTWRVRLVVAVLSGIVVALAYLLYVEKHETPSDASVPRTTRGVLETAPVEVPSGNRLARPRARKPIAGLVKFSDGLDKLLSATFTHPAEVYVARFAQPGLEVPPTDEKATLDMLEYDLQDALDDPIFILSDDSRAIADLKRIVSGIKEEVSLLLTSGKSIEDVRVWLEGRQKMEADYRQQIVSRLEIGELSADEANGMLVSMGFAPVDAPPTSQQPVIKADE